MNIIIVEKYDIPPLLYYHHFYSPPIIVVRGEQSEVMRILDKKGCNVKAEIYLLTHQGSCTPMTAVRMKMFAEY